MELTIRIYTPGDPFHVRKSFFEKRKGGEMFFQFALWNWAIMFGWVDVTNIKNMPFFMWVSHE